MSIFVDYIPRKDSELAIWSANFTAIVASNAASWGISSDEVSALQTACTIFSELYAKTDSPTRTSVLVAEKNTARKTLVYTIRTLVKFRLKNPIITNAQRVLLGLPAYGTSRTPVPRPTTRPEIDVDVLDVRRLKVVFRDMGSSSKAKPYGINGAVIAYAVLDTPPVDISSLVHSTLATRTPHILEFTEEERGKKVYMAICWQNRKGQRGSWSEIESAIVP